MATAAAPAKAAKAVKQVAKSRRGTRVAKRVLPEKAGSLVTLWRLARLGRRLVKGELPAGTETLREGAELVREVTELARGYGFQELAQQLSFQELAQQLRFQELAQQLRRIPVQLSIDVAVPVAVAYDEWMLLESLPEGGHRVEDIERRGRRRLLGEIRSSGAVRKWEAEVRDERRDESFAWRTVRGSDVAGLITFHRLAKRLTRLELELDVVPVSVGEALALTAHLSDRMANAELRRFKSRVETMSPDNYPERAHHPDRRAPKRNDRANRRAPKRNNRASRRAEQGKARTRQSRTQRKEE